MLNKFLNKLDQFFLEINDYWEDKKRKIKFWFVDKVQTIEKFSNPTKVILASLISFCIYRYFTEQALGKETSNAYWTLATLFISSPVAFIIWHFRDKNITQQIENQRKDINLKEFQKIAEWVSGLHLVEDEVTEQFKNSARKRIIKTQRSSNQKETTRKYPQQSEHLSIPTFSKKDGAVGLQIAAIYNLLPFYRGEHGESFKKPALNLLLSAWLALQQKEVKNLENFDVLTNRLDFDNTVKKIQENGRSPIGIAITHVLLADGGGHLVQYPEVFPNLCLAGMDFHLPGLDKNVLSLFINIKNCSGINLIAANLHSARLDGARLDGARLVRASLDGARLYGARLERARLDGARLDGARLVRASLDGASLDGARLDGACLDGASLVRASLVRASLVRASLDGASLDGARLDGACLVRASLVRASLDGARLDGARLDGARLVRASLDGASLDGAIFTYNTDSDINWADLKSKGGVILYFTASERKRDIRMQLVKAEAKFFHYVLDNIDIEKTQQENPDWKIFIIK
ncbi:pentapeptide repeat-containing protein [Pasteurella multocida]|uniref:pentapeptide repeat-containing protein n=1 Tax=Pasteurella multocida TaxID=747 RepID=UPI000DFFF42F|nr:pentapeptide repeat-containing protein [Pasteurella multocida]SUB41914.1 pentapeptide repeat-containing protein [Pasteurella multocida subsp. septica]